MTEGTGRPGSGTDDGGRRDPWAPPPVPYGPGPGGTGHGGTGLGETGLGGDGGGGNGPRGNGRDTGFGPGPVSGPEHGPGHPADGGASGMSSGSSPYGEHPAYRPSMPRPPGPVGPGPGWEPGPPPRSASGKCVAAMVLGIAGLAAAGTCWGAFVGVFLSPLALGLGLSAKRACDRGELFGRGPAVGGYVTGIVGTVLNALIVMVLLVLFVVAGLGFGEYDTDPGGGSEGHSYDARGGTAAPLLPGAADRAA